MIIVLIFLIFFTYNNIVKNEVIQYIEWNNITQTNLHFKIGSTFLFSVLNNTGDHNIVIKESSQNSSKIIKSPVLNFNNQIYYIYTFIKGGNYSITDDFSNNSINIKISSPQRSSLTFLNNITINSDNDDNSTIAPKENNDLDFNKFFKDSKELNDTSSTSLSNKKSIHNFFSNYTISSNSAIKNTTKTKKPTSIIVLIHHSEKPDIVFNSNSNSDSNSELNLNSNSNSIQPPSIYYLIIYISILFIF
ncbi:hypothetical protein ACTFIV_001623 [Dictyostelium citrinum]